MDGVLAGGDGADGEGVGLAGGPGDAFSESVVAGGGADPDVEFSEAAEFFVDIGGDGFAVLQVIDGGEVDGGDAVFFVVIDDPLKAGSESLAVADVAMTALESADDGDLVVVGDAAFSLVVEGGGDADGGAVVALAFVFRVVVAIDAVVGDEDFGLIAVGCVPFGHVEVAAVVHEGDGLAASEGEAILIGFPDAGDSCVLERGGIGGFGGEEE